MCRIWDNDIITINPLGLGHYKDNTHDHLHWERDRDH